MDRQERIDFILDHHDKPRHRGVLSAADAVYSSGNPGCGDVVTVYLSVDGPEQATRLSFEGEGCTISQASASMVMEMMQGKSLHQIEEATPEPLLAKLGPDIAKARERCATLAFNAVKNACREYRRIEMQSQVQGGACAPRRIESDSFEEHRGHTQRLSDSAP